MCSVLAGLTALSGIVSYAGQQQAARAQADAYREEAKVAEANARYKAREQEQAADNAAIEDRRLRTKQRIHAGQVRAAAGAAGLSSEAGSPLDVLNAGWDAYDQDKMISLSNQRNINFNKRVEQSNFENRAAAYNSAADNVMANARLAGIGTILGTATAIAGQGAFDGGSNSSSGSAFTGTPGGSISSPIAGNTTATWTPGLGYDFSKTNLYGKTLMPKNYFPYK